MAAALAMLVATPALLKGAGVDNWWWLVAAAAIAAAIATVPGKIYEDKLKRQFQRREEVRLALTKAVLGGGRCRVRDVADPTLLGVHPAILSDDPLPPYVHRDVHDEVVACLRPGQFVLLVGDSTAGKTRTAYEAVKAELPDHFLIVPDRAGVLDAALDAVAGSKRSILWLDDVERFLGADGLTVAGVARAGDGVIVATLRREELRRLEDDGGAARVLSQARRITLERRFTDTELIRARVHVADPRIQEALEHAHEYGIAEYLAAAPELLNNWLDAWAPGTRPRGAALVEAAIDCRRGFLGEIPQDFLMAAHEYHLARRGGQKLSPEPPATAWEWATTPRRATAAMLELTEDDGVRVFDYLLDHVQRTRPQDYGLRERTLAMIEFAAVRITCVGVSLIPPLLQTRPYARAVFEYVFRGDPQFLDDRVELRMDRQRVLDRVNVPELIVYLDERTLEYPRGDDQDYAEQLRRLLTIAERPNVELRVLPLSGHAALGGGGNYMVFEFENAAPVVIVESLGTNLLFTDRDVVGENLRVSAILTRQAWEAERSLDLVAQRLSAVGA